MYTIRIYIHLWRCLPRRLEEGDKARRDLWLGPVACRARVALLRLDLLGLKLALEALQLGERGPAAVRQVEDEFSSGRW